MARVIHWVQHNRLVTSFAVLVVAAIVAVLLLVSPGTQKPPSPESSDSTQPSTPVGTDQAQLNRLLAQKRPIYCGAPTGNLVALTFDDGPGPYTPNTLAKLRGAGAHASFFLVGRELSRGADLPRQEAQLASLGDHTWTHPQLTRLPVSQATDQVVRTKDAVTQASGAQVRLFRPPYGAFNPQITNIANGLGMVEILWSVDSRDSEGANFQQIANNVKDGLKPGAIILMHENRGQTLRALPQILDELKRRNLRAVSLSELLSQDPPSTAQLNDGARGCGPSSAAFQPGAGG
jgi:peptidoglycan/xylan/chitin deacetylase (PgdA/CDA1 family)